MSIKKTVFVLIASLLVTINTLAQAVKSASHNDPNGKDNAASFGINVPVGEFSKTHIGGISLGYSWSHHRFGNLQALPKKIISFTANGSIDYYVGRKETITGFNYRYGGYLYLHAFAGAIYNPCKKGNISVTTGPTLGIYKDGADAGFGVSLGGDYSLTDKYVMRSGISYLKHKEAAALWVFNISVAYIF